MKSLVTGFFCNVAQRVSDGTYRKIGGAVDEQLEIHPSSVLCNIKPKWVLFNELVATTKRYMREVSAIEFQWILDLVPNFYKDTR